MSQFRLPKTSFTSHMCPRFTRDKWAHDTFCLSWCFPFMILQVFFYQCVEYLLRVIFRFPTPNLQNCPIHLLDCDCSIIWGVIRIYLLEYVEKQSASYINVSPFKHQKTQFEKPFFSPSLSHRLFFFNNNKRL